MERHFCTCPVKTCGNHPVRHEKGCDLCIEKNLKNNEIPACFFLKISPDAENLTDFTVDGFVDFFLKHKRP